MSTDESDVLLYLAEVDAHVRKLKSGKLAKVKMFKNSVEAAKPEVVNPGRPPMVGVPGEYPAKRTHPGQWPHLLDEKFPKPKPGEMEAKYAEKAEELRLKMEKEVPDLEQTAVRAGFDVKRPLPKKATEAQEKLAKLGYEVTPKKPKKDPITGKDVESPQDKLRRVSAFKKPVIGLDPEKGVVVDPKPKPKPRVAKAAAGTPAATDLGTTSDEPQGKMRPVTDEDRKNIVIPPAWTDVEVSDDPKAKIVARGRDAAGRVQAIYSAEHHAEAARAKYERVAKLVSILPKLGEALERDAGNDSADALALIARMGLRPGSTSDTKAKVQAFGATTLQARHVRVTPGGKVTLDFIGKKGVKIVLPVEDDDLREMLKGRKGGKKPNEALFPQASAAKIRTYMDEAAGSADYSPKDLRTALATALALAEVAKGKPPSTAAEYKKRRLEVGKVVAAKLGNRPAQALESYISPTVFAPWEGVA